MQKKSLHFPFCARRAVYISAREGIVRGAPRQRLQDMQVLTGSRAQADMCFLICVD
jgi:hypothetical protein